MQHERLGVEEMREGEWTRLSLTGELDLSTAGVLRTRLLQLKDANEHVRLDLSQLEFIDSSGGHVLADVIAQSRADHWRVELEPAVSRQVERFFALTKASGGNLGM